MLKYQGGLVPLSFPTPIPFTNEPLTWFSAVTLTLMLCWPVVGELKTENICQPWYILKLWSFLAICQTKVLIVSDNVQVSALHH